MNDLEKITCRVWDSFHHLFMHLDISYLIKQQINYNDHVVYFDYDLI